jgi:hypothetical protein
MMVDGLAPAGTDGDAGESRPARDNATPANHSGSPPTQLAIRAEHHPDRESDIAGVVSARGFV